MLLSQACLVGLLIANGFSPYLGLKTESSFAMFSNIRTEGGRSNHLFIPNYQLFDYQKTLVEVVESTDSRLDRARETNRVLPYYELMRRMQRLRNAGIEARVTYRTQDGQSHSLSTTTDTAELRNEPPFLVRKFLTFRPVETEEVVPCGH